MDLLKKLNSKKEPVEVGEELLHKEYKISNQPNREVRLLIGVDGGSTQTRSTIIDVDNLSNFDQDIQIKYVIPSTSSTVPDDRQIKGKSDNLYDIMDSSIRNLSDSEESIFGSVRLVRGSKAFNAELTENRLGSSTQKTQDVTYYYNLIDNLGYSLLLKYQDKVPEKASIWLALALPPDDINPVNEKRLKKNLKSFKWIHKETGVEITFEVREILLRTEPEAFIKAFYALSDKETPDRTLHLEGGGRSIGAEILVNGKSLDQAQKTLDFGGSQLLTKISDLYVAQNGGSPLRTNVLKEAISTGKLKVGNSTIDISDIVDLAKKELGKQIVSQIIATVFDQQSRVSVTDLNVISVSGRLFGYTPVYDKEGNLIKESSIADYVKSGFSSVSPTTDFVFIEDNHIPAGLVLEGILEFFADSFESEGDEFQEVVEEAAPSTTHN